MENQQRLSGITFKGGSFRTRQKDIPTRLPEVLPKALTVLLMLNNDCMRREDSGGVG